RRVAFDLAYAKALRRAGRPMDAVEVLDGVPEEFFNDISVISETADALRDGNIVGMNIPGGAPVSAITRAYAQMGGRMTVLGWTDRDLETVNKRYPLWDWYELAPGTYPNQEETVRTVASPNVLVARADVPADHVYRITKVIWEKLATLQEIHGATKDMRLEAAVRGLGAPLHAGALRYFREVGLDIPERLIPEDADTLAEPSR
ncbi:MAG: TAXI family TRAP transporter solute-binding subunit, partial [Pseudomonadota bacterium]